MFINIFYLIVYMYAKISKFCGDNVTVIIVSKPHLQAELKRELH